MKGKCFLALVLLTTLTLPAVQAQDFLPGLRFCMVDGFTFEWNVKATCQGCNCTISGSVVIPGSPSSPWAASGTINRCNGQVNLTATNPQPDGCTTQSGSFNYIGSFAPSGGGQFSGGGTWTNDCGLSGDWFGTASRGPCPLRTSQPAPGMNPAMSQAAAAAAPASLTTNPDGYGLGASYPNPFTSAATITYALPETQHVSIRVYDVLGRQVATVVNEVREAGTHTVQWEASSELPAGTYVYRIQAGSYTDARQMMLVK